MRGAVLHASRDIRVDQREDPKLEQSTDAVIRLAATCVCGSDLWPYRGIEAVDGPAPMGHEYAGVVEEVGRDVRNVKPGQFVIGSFFASDNTCEICLHGGPSPVRGFLPELIRLICDRTIHPGLVFDLTLPLDKAAEGYRAMDERRAIKTLLRP